MNYYSFNEYFLRKSLTLNPLVIIVFPALDLRKELLNLLLDE